VFHTPLQAYYSKEPRRVLIKKLLSFVSSLLLYPISQSEQITNFSSERASCRPSGLIPRFDECSGDSFSHKRMHMHIMAHIHLPAHGVMQPRHEHLRRQGAHGGQQHLFSEKTIVHVYSEMQLKTTKERSILVRGALGRKTRCATITLTGSGGADEWHRESE
jgi:hypothetical protein